MNYYMPYFNMYPSMISSVAPTATASKGLLARFFGKGLNWGSILNTTQKTLSLVNQAIPVIKQVSPVMKNAKTIFKVMNEFKRIDSPSVPNNIQDKNIEINNSTTSKTENTSINFDGTPTFFIN